MKKVVAAAVVVAIVAAAWIGVTAIRRSPPTTVGYVGDSITDQSRDPLQSELGADPDLIKAVSGVRIEGMLQPAKDLAAADPDQVVINLGTNNVLGDDQLDHEVAALRELVSVFPRARCIHLVTINEHMVLPPHDTSGQAHRLNDQIHAMAAADARLRVIDWAKIVIDYDAAKDPNGPVTYDTVHPAEAGEALLIDAYRTSLDGCSR